MMAVGTTSADPIPPVSPASEMRTGLRFSPYSEAPIRAEIFGVEHLEAHARDLQSPQATPGLKQASLCSAASSTTVAFSNKLII